MRDAQQETAGHSPKLACRNGLRHTNNRGDVGGERASPRRPSRSFKYVPIDEPIPSQTPGAQLISAQPPDGPVLASIEGDALVKESGDNEVQG